MNQKAPFRKLETRRGVYFQIGLIVSISFCLVAFVWTSYDLKDQSYIPETLGETIYVEVERIPVSIPKPPRNAESFSTVFKLVKDDDSSDKKKDKKKKEPVFDSNYDPDAYDWGDEPDDVVFVLNNKPLGFFAVEQKPFFKSCENILDPAAEAQCTYSEIIRFVSSNARYPMGSKMRGEKGKVTVSFVIGKDGKVKDVEVLKGDWKDLNKEAARVVGTLPEFEPGAQNGRPVEVTYQIPVNFEIK